MTDFEPCPWNPNEACGVRELAKGLNVIEAERDDLRRQLAAAQYERDEAKAMVTKLSTPHKMFWYAGWKEQSARAERERERAAEARAERDRLMIALESVRADNDEVKRELPQLRREVEAAIAERAGLRERAEQAEMLAERHRIERDAAINGIDRLEADLEAALAIAEKYSAALRAMFDEDDGETVVADFNLQAQRSGTILGKNRRALREALAAHERLKAGKAESEADDE